VVSAYEIDISVSLIQRIPMLYHRHAETNIYTIVIGESTSQNEGNQGGKGEKRKEKRKEKKEMSVDDLQEPKAQVARAAHTLSVCKRHLTHKLLSLQ
jgi:hypothetical protein